MHNTQISVHDSWATLKATFQIFDLDGILYYVVLLYTSSGVYILFISPSSSTIHIKPTKLSGQNILILGRLNVQTTTHDAIKYTMILFVLLSLVTCHHREWHLMIKTIIEIKNKTILLNISTHQYCIKLKYTS